MCSEVTTSAIGVLGSCRVSAFFCRSHKYIHIESQTEGETWKWWQLHFSFQWINVYLQFGSAYMFVCVWVCVVNLDKWEVIVSMTPMIAFKVILLVFRWMVLVLDVYHFDLDHLPYCMMAVCVCVCSVLNWLVVMCIRQTRMFMGWLEAMAKVSIIRLDAWLVMCNR